MASECALKKGDLVRIDASDDGPVFCYMADGLKLRLNSLLIGAVGIVSCPYVNAGNVKIDLLPICHGMGGIHGPSDDPEMDPIYVSPECVKPVEGSAFVCKTVESYAVFDRRDVKNPVAEFSRSLNNAREVAERVCSGLLEEETPAVPRERFTIERNSYNISVIDNSIPEHNVITCLTNDYKAGTLDAETIATSLCDMLNAGCVEGGGKKGDSEK